MKKDKKIVKEMFDDIAPKYDFLNHFLSFGIDKIWRRKAVKMLKELQPKHVLDVATGTGDFAIQINKDLGAKVTGIDISVGMLEMGKIKIKNLNLESQISLEEGDSTNLVFEDNTFDALTVAFGVRNFEDLPKGLKEMNRVIKPAAKAVILEFSKPTLFPFKQLYTFYSKYILPVLGGMFSKNKNAYTYLPESVKAFPDGDKFLDIMSEAGFNNCKKRILTLGIVTIYTGIK
ncbi:MAG: bifunctional demethylmenaquinone methyltransferase/2-methoxy-6-polyprenyl-1,4-benzoquinol methylase UbiE [Marinifilaceae bacterium]